MSTDILWKRIVDSERRIAILETLVAEMAEQLAGMHLGCNQGVVSMDAYLRSTLERVAKELKR